MIEEKRWPRTSASLLSKTRRLIDASSLREGVRRDIVASLYPRSFRIGTSHLTSIVNGLILATVMRSWLPVGWMAVSLAICTWRTADWWRYQWAPASWPASDWAFRFTVRLLPFGTWWGTTALLLFATNDPLVMAIAVLSTNALGAGVVCSYPGHPPAVLAFILPAMTAFVVCGTIHGGVIGYTIAFVEIVLITNYLIIVREFYRSTVSALILREEKTDLANNLAEAHAALQREGMAKSEFLAHMSHELRTPLNAIIGFSELIKGEIFGPVGNDTYRGYVADIEASANHLLNIVNEVLDVARIEAGELSVQIAEVDPAYVLQFAARLVDQQAAIKNLKLELDIDADVGAARLRTDEVRLKQVIINMLSNAIKFTEHGSVKLGARVDAGDVVFEISDTGPGMSPEELKRALQPFIQVGNPLLAREGAGLGLPLSRQLVERLGGRFEIASTAGVGTTVIIRLPASPTPQP